MKRQAKPKDKAIGVTVTALGILILGAFLIFFQGDWDNMKMHGSEVFLVNFLPPIFLINTAVVFVLFGLLICFGLVLPYISQDINEYERAKNQALILILSTPTWLAFSAFVLTMAFPSFFKIIWFLFIILILWTLFSSIRKISSAMGKRTHL